MMSKSLYHSRKDEGRGGGPHLPGRDLEVERGIEGPESRGIVDSHLGVYGGLRELHSVWRIVV